MRTLRERLLAKTAVSSSTGCWEWTGRKDVDGYGKISANGDGSARTHRVAYELFVGPIPQGLVIDHLCRNRACCNPAHLEPVTRVVNTLRSPIQFCAINATKTHCPSGHEYTPENTRVSGGSRYCRACNRAAVARYRSRKAIALADTKSSADANSRLPKPSGEDK